MKINDIQLNEPFNENDYEINHHIKLIDTNSIMIKHKDLTVKVKNKHQTVKDRID